MSKLKWPRHKYPLNPLVYPKNKNNKPIELTIDQILYFKKYKNKKMTVKDIFDIDPEYIQWLIKNDILILKNGKKRKK